MLFIPAYGKYCQPRDLFHILTRGARLQRWAREKTLSFVPPDGKFVLAEYQYALPHGALVGNVPVPLALKPNITVGEFGGALIIFVLSLCRVMRSDDI